MRPGSWLEINPYSPEMAKRLHGSNGVQSIIVSEPTSDSHETQLTGRPATILEMSPEVPFILKIHDISEISLSKWARSPLFKGFLWAANCASSFEAIDTIKDSKYGVWLDYQVQNPKRALKILRQLEHIPLAGFYCSPANDLPLRKFHNLLSSMPDSLSLLRSISRPHEIQDLKFSEWSKLELFRPPEFEANPLPAPKYSIVIPHYENPHFLCNMLRHIATASELNPDKIEVLVVDDFSKEATFRYICSFAKRFLPKLSLRLFRWEQDFFNTEKQRLFRAGASRNWGAEFARGERLLFLDSDMLVPQNIVSILDQCFQDAEFIQFVRHHIPASLSTESVHYSDLINSDQLYIEEASYWQKLFEHKNWMEMKDFWKYTCTYALSMSRELFFEAGRFRRNFIRYGFEDTDLGFRVALLDKKFSICKTPLLHLTATPDKSQGWFYKIDKTERLKPMARTFYALNYQKDLYPKFQGLFD